MAVDPYRKSRRIRNVIHAAKRLAGAINATPSLFYSGIAISPEALRKISKLISRELWKTKDCNIWQG